MSDVESDHYETMPCDDCAVNTSPYGGIGEHYMVADAIWLEAGMNEPASERPPTGPVEQLCIGCLENRIGRRLTPEDFLHPPSSRDPESWLYANASERLSDRLKPRAASDKDEVERLKRVIRAAHNDLNDPDKVEFVRSQLRLSLTGNLPEDR